MRWAAPMVALLATAAVFAADAPVLIQNATILTITHGTINKGSILLDNGKIAAIGERLAAPAGATIVDGSGKYVMPGIIDCHSHIMSEAINENSVPVSSMVAMSDVLNPEDIAIYRALAGGVTTANILHGSANPIGGQTLVMKMRWGLGAEQMKFEGAMPGIKFALGENPKRRGNSGPGGPALLRYPATRMGVEDVIREAFTEAKAYQASWDEYKQKSARGETAIPPARDLKLEPLVEVLEGKRLVHAHCYRQDEILMLLRVADEFGFKIRTLQHALEAYKVAKEIADHGAGASTFSDWWAYKAEAYDAIPYNATLMMRKGVLVSLNSDSAELMRHLNDEAAKTMKYGGATEDEALAMITINPAKQLAIDNHVGSIEAGKDGDITIFDKHPLSNYAKVDKVFIDGEKYFDREEDLAERPKKDSEKKMLIEKEKQMEQQQRRPGAARRPAE